ncbi:hypothetical protein TH66_12150 [Carbonactinospora thermoautotrophica]|uniref:Uncharacterized protein n=1 Tax=Carbonactinospora thermoautotrophica TaxID=1469144 RepID=A0A132N0I7_9ACTN|nr:hypothetical protein TH66_12150 [Carbonactinospora thermoautotrophica]
MIGWALLAHGTALSAVAAAISQGTGLDRPAPDPLATIVAANPGWAATARTSSPQARSRRSGSATNSRLASLDGRRRPE